MGLDITAYKRVLITHPHERSDACWKGDPWHTRAFVYDGMEQSLRGLVPDRCYIPDPTSWENSYGFRAGSYSGYGEFRETLCQAALGVNISDVWAKPEIWRERPFYELLNFADNEGTIGPQAAEDLAADFVSHREIVRPKLGEWHQESYDNWQTAFELAAGEGMVVFH